MTPLSQAIGQSVHLAKRGYRGCNPLTGGMGGVPPKPPLIRCGADKSPDWSGDAGCAATRRRDWLQSSAKTPPAE